MSDYRAERAITIFTYIAIGLVVISLLSFLGVFSFGFSQADHCNLPRGFQCDEFIISENTIELHMEYTGQPIFELSIKGDGCTSYETGNVPQDSSLVAIIPCNTGEKGSSIRQDFEFTFLRQGSASITTSRARVRGIVE